MLFRSDDYSHNVLSSFPFYLMHFLAIHDPKIPLAIAFPLLVYTHPRIWKDLNCTFALLALVYLRYSCCLTSVLHNNYSVQRFGCKNVLI